MRRTRIIGTIGPASDSPEMIEALLKAGLNVARLNYSHGTPDQKTELIKRLRDAESSCGIPIGILADLPGPKLRLGTFPGKIQLVDDETVELHCGEDGWNEDQLGGPGHRMLPVAYPGLSGELRDGDPVLLNDGTVRMEVVSSPGKEGSMVTCRVLEPGTVSSRKGINVPGTLVKLPSVGAKDIEALDHALDQGVDFIAVSYVRTPEDLLPAKRMIDERAPGTPIIAKIEHPVAIEHLDGILDVAGGIMVARGDLGVEIPYEEVPLVQESIIQSALERGLPVVVATQVLESMVSSPVPTRAEVTDIANSIRQGTHALMLSGETASGDYPLQAVETMARVATHVDNALSGLAAPPALSSYKSTRAVANAAVALTKEADARRMLVATSRGTAARLVSAYRPPCAITAMTDNVQAMRRNCILWGVDSVLVKERDRSRDTIKDAISQMIADGRLNPGDNLVSVTGSPKAISGSTSTVRFIRLDDSGNVLDEED